MYRNDAKSAMKLSKLHSFAGICLLLMMTFAFAGCRDKCKRITCVNGTCAEGICNCSTGYFHEDCAAVINAAFPGTWTNSEECTAGSDGYSISMLTAGSSKTDLQLVGIWELNADTVLASVDANGLDISIGRQSVGGVEIAGEGLANADQDELTLTYRVYNLGQSNPFDVCTAVLSKN
jgi:hypothetical protein